MIAESRAREALLSSTAVNCRPLKAPNARSSRMTREKILFDKWQFERPSLAPGSGPNRFPATTTLYGQFCSASQQDKAFSMLSWYMRNMFFIKAERSKRPARSLDAGDRPLMYSSPAASGHRVERSSDSKRRLRRWSS